MIRDLVMASAADDNYIIDLNDYTYVGSSFSVAGQTGYVYYPRMFFSDDGMYVFVQETSSQKRLYKMRLASAFDVNSYTGESSYNALSSYIGTNALTNNVSQKFSDTVFIGVKSGTTNTIPVKITINGSVSAENGIEDPSHTYAHYFMSADGNYIYGVKATGVINRYTLDTAYSLASMNLESVAVGYDYIPVSVSGYQNIQIVDENNLIVCGTSGTASYSFYIPDGDLLSSSNTVSSSADPATPSIRTGICFTPDKSMFYYTYYSGSQFLFYKYTRN